MRGRLPTTIAAALALGAAACGPEDFGDSREVAAEEAGSMAADPGEEWRVQLIEADRAFARATADRGVEGWLEWFAPQGSMVRGEGEIVGHPEIREAMDPFLSDSTMALRWTPSRAEVSEDGTLGFTVGPYEVVATDPAPGEEAVRSRGMYLTVWRHQADGSWKVVADIGSPTQ